MNYEEEIRKLSKDLHETARQHLDSRQIQARLRYDLEFSVARVLSKYRAEKRNVGYDMAILMRLEQATQENDVKWLNMYRDYLYHTARYKGLEAAMEAIKNEIMGIQSILRFYREGEEYGTN